MGRRLGTIDRRNPVEWSHPLNAGRALWLLGLPGRAGGGRAADLGRRHDGVLRTSGAALPAWVSGPLGFTGWSVDGTSNSIQVPLASVLGLGAFAAAAWVRGAAVADFGVVFGAGHGGNWHALRSGSGASCQLATGVSSYSLSLSGVFDGSWHRLLLAYDGASFRGYLDGWLGRSTAAAGAVAESTELGLGAFGNAGADNKYGGEIADFSLWSLAGRNADVFAAAEYAEARRGHPETLRRLARRAWLFGASAGGTAYSLAAGSGAVALVGTPAGLRAARAVSAGPGAFAWAGGGAALRAGRVVPAPSGSFSESGSPAALRVGRRLPAAAGSANLSGTPAVPRAARRLPAGAAAYALAGSDATLTDSDSGAKGLAAGAGQFVLSGSPAGARTARRVSAAAGHFALAGTPAAARAARRIAAGTGILNLAGSPSGSRVPLTLAASAGSFALAGAATAFGAGRDGRVLVCAAVALRPSINAAAGLRPSINAAAGLRDC